MHKGERISTYALFLSLTGIIFFFATCSSNDNAAPATASSGAGNGPQVSFPQVNGPVFAMVSDGADGVYVGGRFTPVNTIDRPYLAHIKANGTINVRMESEPRWAAFAVLQDRVLYIGGNFLNMNGEERWRLAAVDRVTAVLTPWDPRLGSANLVNALASSGAVIYVGGV